MTERFCLVMCRCKHCFSACIYRMQNGWGCKGTVDSLTSGFPIGPYSHRIYAGISLVCYTLIATAASGIPICHIAIMTENLPSPSGLGRFLEQDPGVDKTEEPPSSSRRRATVHRTAAFKLFDSLCSKIKGTPMGCLLFWSRIRESNPPSRLGKPLYYRYTNPAFVWVL